MKRSFLTVLAASSLLVLGACSSSDDTAADTTDAETVVVPVPAPMPMDSGTMMTTDSMNHDSTMMTTTGM